MTDTAIASFTDGTTANATDRIAASRSPYAAGDDRYLTPAYIKTYIFSSGTLTTSQPLQLTQTWNAGGVTFTGLGVNITDTASAAASLLMDLQVGGTSKLNVNKGGGIASALNTFGTSNATIKGTSLGLNFFNTAAYFQSATDVVMSVTASGTAGNVMVSNTGQYSFSSSSPGSSGADVAFNRNAAGVVEVNNGTSGTYRDLKLRSLLADATNTAGGTTGAQTINKSAGTVNFAAAATTLTVTNSLCTTSSLVFATVRTNDTTATIKNVVPGSGSFVITLSAAATAETSVGFLVIN
jgi:hypothetical protein